VCGTELNIWALDKDISIKHLLLLLLQERIDVSCYIHDEHDMDSRAVRLSNPEEPGYSVYIYTYGQDHEKYGVHLEYANIDDSTVKDTVEEFDNISFDRLVELLKVQFNEIGSGPNGINV
jgi:hypothetical protein